MSINKFTYTFQIKGLIVISKTSLPAASERAGGGARGRGGDGGRRPVPSRPQGHHLDGRGRKSPPAGLPGRHAGS